MSTSATAGKPADPSKNQSQKIVRVRSGCWTCKARRRKCDEAKPFCMNCVKNNRQCEGYNIRLSFDVDDSRHTASGIHFDVKGRPVVGFRRRPRLKESMAVRDSCGASFVVATGEPGQTSLAGGMGPGSMPTAGPMGISTLGSLAEEPDQVAKSLKFVVHNNFDGTRRRKKRSVDDDASAKKPKLEDIDQAIAADALMDPLPSLESAGSSQSGDSPDRLSSASVSSPRSLGLFEPSADFIKKEDSNEFGMHDYARINPDGVFQNALRPSNGDQSYPKNLQSTLLRSGGDASMFRNAAPKEQELLHYFFTELSPLLDNHKNSPLAGLALTFCSSDLVLSSFTCLACVHLSTKLRNESYYALGLEYHSRTINYLGEIIASVSKPSQTPGANVQHGLSVAVLTVIYLLITYEILDNGKSITLRSHLAAFASIIQDRDLAADVLAAINGNYLFRVFAWYDILTAAASKDHRALNVPGAYFFPSSTVDSGIEGVMGCPDELMLAIGDIVTLRHDMRYKNVLYQEIQSRATDIETRIRNYRSLKKWDGRESFAFIQYMTASQCWAQASNIFLLRSTGLDPSNQRIQKSVEEFVRLYKSMEVGSDCDRQMVWPLFVVGCELKTAHDRQWLTGRIAELNAVVNKGSLKTLSNVLTDVWRENKSWEDVLSTDDWQKFDFLPL
ncbi:fungal-specific transcription factor domain-containing protein [Dipodascopsis tothii]|uniref:fungal-specific transcription factor domain-containing protein n=1 Tax=Dipodascopsis tothii TaxID=44089 RepID=UPI0034D01C4A